MKPYRKHNRINYIVGLFLLCIVSSSFCRGAGMVNDSILRVLNSEIDHRYSYYEEKEKRMETLRQQFHYRKKLPEKFETAGKLFEEYITYQYDSAYTYACRMAGIASQLNDRSLKTATNIHLLHCYVAAGLFKEGAELMSLIDSHDLNEKEKAIYYWLCMRFYANLKSYTSSPALSVGYTAKSQIYCDSVLMYLSPDTPEYAQTEVFGYYESKSDPQEKIEKLHSVIDRYKFSGRNYAILYVLLAKEYKLMNNREKAIYYSALSSLYDIRTASRQTTSKTLLGQCLYEEGDVMFASKCIRNALEDANFYNARHRKIEVNSILPIIEYEKNRIIQQQKGRLELYLVLLGILVMSLGLATFLIFRQNKKLGTARKVIQQHCDEISLVNTKLTEANKLLVQSRMKLEESNEIKDVYIVQSLYGKSEYLDRFELLLKKVSYKVKSKQYDDLKNLYKEYDSKFERDNMFSSFDKAFLILFPNFIDEYNKLFNPEDQVGMDGNGNLSTELRIFALLRLGFSDIEQIAKFLNLTVKTVYSYKWKIKAKTIIPKEDFERRIMAIKKLGANPY